MGRHVWDVSIAQMLGSWLPPVGHSEPSDSDISTHVDPPRLRTPS